MSDPKIIYHYTSQKGLLGILKDDKIWATHIQYLNDSTEFHYAVKLAKDVLSSMQDEICTDLSELIDELFLNPQLPDIYVTSFSALQDDLSQWRAYCPSLGGFAIGFDKGELSSICKKEQGTLKRCEYLRKKQVTMIQKFISRARAPAEKASYIDSDETSHELEEIIELIGKSRLDFAIDLLRAAPFLKDSKFKDETEWRLTIHRKLKSEAKVHYREGFSMIVPYLELCLLGDQNKSLPIKEIVVGPCPNKNLSKMAVEKMILDREFHACKVILSEVPYRPW